MDVESRTWRDIIKTPIILFDDGYVNASRENDKLDPPTAPSNAPSISFVPSQSPSLNPTLSRPPTKYPSTTPSSAPSRSPSVMPSFIPSRAPSARYEKPNGGCAVGSELYQLEFRDTAGDGWSDTALAIQQKGSPEIEFKKTMESNSAKVEFHYKCLQKDACYSIKVGGGDEIWQWEISWILYKIENSGFKNITAAGIAPYSCEFPSSQNNCSNTCGQTISQTLQNISPSMKPSAKPPS